MMTFMEMKIWIFLTLLTWLPTLTYTATTSNPIDASTAEDTESTTSSLDAEITEAVTVASMTSDTSTTPTTGSTAATTLSPPESNSIVTLTYDPPTPLSAQSFATALVQAYSNLTTPVTTGSRRRRELAVSLVDSVQNIRYKVVVTSITFPEVEFYVIEEDTMANTTLIPNAAFVANLLQQNVGLLQGFLSRNSIETTSVDLAAEGPCTGKTEFLALNMKLLNLSDQAETLATVKSNSFVLQLAAGLSYVQGVSKTDISDCSTSAVGCMYTICAIALDPSCDVLITFLPVEGNEPIPIGFMEECDLLDAVDLQIYTFALRGFILRTTYYFPEPSVSTVTSFNDTASTAVNPDPTVATEALIDETTAVAENTTVVLSSTTFDTIETTNDAVSGTSIVGSSTLSVVINSTSGSDITASTDTEIPAEDNFTSISTTNSGLTEAMSVASEIVATSVTNSTSSLPTTSSAQPTTDLVSSASILTETGIFTCVDVCPVDAIPTWVWIVISILALVCVILLIVLIICCIRFRKEKGAYEVQSYRKEKGAYEVQRNPHPDSVDSPIVLNAPSPSPEFLNIGNDTTPVQNEPPVATRELAPTAEPRENVIHLDHLPPLQSPPRLIEDFAAAQNSIDEAFNPHPSLFDHLPGYFSSSDRIGPPSSPSDRALSLPLPLQERPIDDTRNIIHSLLDDAYSWARPNATESMFDPASNTTSLQNGLREPGYSSMPATHGRNSTPYHSRLPQSSHRFSPR